MLTGAVTAGSMLLQAASVQTAPAPATVAQQLADKLDVAFRACSQQLTNRDYLSEKNKRPLGDLGIVLGSPPPEVQAMATRLFGSTGIYASIATPQGKLWVSASATAPVCKATLADTQWALTARYDWITKLRSTPLWKFDRSRSGNNGQILRDLFVLNPDRPGGHMIVFIDGPNSIANEGQGIQMIMTVALEAAKAQ